jgi:hypothetical protein
MIIQPIFDTSVATNAVASVELNALITNEVPLTIVPREIKPSAAAPVAPIVCLVNMTIEFVVIAVVATVAVPPTRVTVPNEFAPAVVVVATLVLMILFPAVPRTTLPFVAVIAPRVAVRVVLAVKDPVTAVFPVALPMLTAPVPPVPIVVTAAPEALMLAVPTCVRAARVVRPPVAVNVVPMTAEVVTASEDPAVNVVVEAIVPGAMNVVGILKVRVFNPPVVVIWLVVPAIVQEPVAEGTTGFVPAPGTNESKAIPPPVRAMVNVLPDPVTVTPAPPKIFILPAVGLSAPPVSPVRVTIAPVVPDPREIQFPDPGHI